MSQDFFWWAESGLPRKDGLTGVGSTLSLLGQILELVLIFAVVVALAYFSARFMQRRALGAASGRYLKTVEIIALGTSARLALVQIEGRRLLLGVTDHQISLLAELEEGEQEGPDLEPENGEGPFLERLRALLERARGLRN